MSSLKLDFRDVYGNRLKGKVSIYLDGINPPLATKDFTHKNPSNTLHITDLPEGLYKIRIYPTLYRAVYQNIMIGSRHPNKLSFSCPVDPEKVMGLKAPAYNKLSNKLKSVLDNSTVTSFPDLTGKPLYDALDDLRTAGLLNIVCKMEATYFYNNREAFSYLTSLTKIQRDRIYAYVEYELRDEVKNSPLFEAADDSMHTPPKGFSSAGSFKTEDKYGNLQITFFVNADHSEYMIDADIDDARGIGHIFQVVGHILTNGKTHPYDIHDILIAHQHIDPGYRLTV